MCYLAERDQKRIHVENTDHALTQLRLLRHGACCGARLLWSGLTFVAQLSVRVGDPIWRRCKWRRRAFRYGSGAAGRDLGRVAPLLLEQAQQHEQDRAEFRP